MPWPQWASTCGPGRLRLSLGSQVWFVVLAGAGLGFMLTPASTDAVNRASKLSYGEATGITQTVRNYAASLGLAILGTLLVSRSAPVTSSLISQGVSSHRAAREASSISQFQGGGSGAAAAIPHFIRVDFAHASQSVFYAMAVIMAVAAAAGLLGLQGGRQKDTAGAGAIPGGADREAAAGAESPARP